MTGGRGAPLRGGGGATGAALRHTMPHLPELISEVQKGLSSGGEPPLKPIALFVVSPPGLQPAGPWRLLATVPAIIRGGAEPVPGGGIFAIRPARTVQAAEEPAERSRTRLKVGAGGLTAGPHKRYRGTGPM